MIDVKRPSEAEYPDGMTRKHLFRRRMPNTKCQILSNEERTIIIILLNQQILYNNIVSLSHLFHKMTKRALLIGSNYTATPSVQLGGCINDIVNMRNTLIDAYGYQDQNINVLRDDDANRLPTRANILASMSRLVSMSSPADTLWIHYSGHGTQVRDTNGDEQDKFDECIVPCNYNTAGVITDDELIAILKTARCQLIICFDSCNSGTGCDLQYSMNYNNGTLSKIVNSNSNRIITNPNIIMLSGCRDTQTSADAYDNVSKRGVGAFTQTLLETLRANDHNIALLPLYSKLCANLKAYGFTQIPVLSSSMSSPNFQFVRVNSGVSSSATGANSATATKTKQFAMLEEVVISSPSAKTMMGRMSSLIR